MENEGGQEGDDWSNENGGVCRGGGRQSTGGLRGNKREYIVARSPVHVEVMRLHREIDTLEE